MSETRHKWGKFLSEAAKVIFSGIGGVVLGLILKSNSSEESIVKLWANESDLISENMTLNEAKYAFENEINKLNDLIKERDNEIIKLNSQVDSFNVEYDLARLNNAKSYAETNDFENALKQLREIKEPNSEVKTLVDEYTDKYIKNCINAVDAYVSLDDFESALTYIRNSLEVLPDNKVLLQFLNETEMKKPLKLSEVGIGDYNNFSDYIDRYVNDTTGKKHMGDNVYTINAKDTSGYIRVYLGKEYEKVKGYIAVSENSPIGRDLPGNIEIILDGKQCEYYEVPNRAISPIEFNVSTNGVEWFEIKYNGSYFSLAYAYESFEIVISDVYLYKS